MNALRRVMKVGDTVTLKSGTAGRVVGFEPAYWQTHVVLWVKGVGDVRAPLDDVKSVQIAGERDGEGKPHCPA